jgi:hypothetical protein
MHRQRLLRDDRSRERDREREIERERERERENDVAGFFPQTNVDIVVLLFKAQKRAISHAYYIPITSL